MRHLSASAIEGELEKQTKRKRTRTVRAPRIAKPTRIDALQKKVKLLRDPMHMASVQDGSVEDADGAAREYVAPAEENADHRMDAMMEANFTAHECMEKLTQQKETLSDEQVARLVAHCMAQAQAAHDGTLTITMFDNVVEEAEELLRQAEAFGHNAGAAAFSTLICIQANPANGVARDIPRCLELLQDEAIQRKINDVNGHAPSWVYDTVLKGCAMDEDEEAALTIVEDLAPPLSDVAYEFALSSCNTIAAGERVLAAMAEKVETDTLHMVALMKCATKAKAYDRVDEIFADLLAHDGAGPEAHLALLAARCSAKRPPMPTFHTMMSTLRNGDATPALLSSILHLALIHVSQIGDDYCIMAHKTLEVASKLGYDRDTALLTRAMWVFTRVGDEDTVRALSAKARGVGDALEGHHFELMRCATEHYLFLENPELFVVIHEPTCVHLINHKLNLCSIEWRGFTD